MRIASARAHTHFHLPMLLNMPGHEQRKLKYYQRFDINMHNTILTARDKILFVFGMNFLAFDIAHRPTVFK